MATIHYGHGNYIPGTLSRDGDKEAIRTAISLVVRDGYRNDTWASVHLSDGSTYQVRNAHGRVVARYTKL